LTQPELASLIGLRSASHISRIERGKYVPKVELALAFQVIFGIPPSTMFPNIYTLVEEEVIRNIYKYHLALGKTNTLSGLRKRQMCELVLKRAVTTSNQLEET